jgi:RNA polymerase sigma-70 factor, ECF subfamily
VGERVGVGPAEDVLTESFTRDYSDAVPPEYSSEETLAALVPGDREKAVVMAARRGDEAAAREIYRSYRGPILSLIVSLVGDPLQAQDILQVVFFKTFRGLAGFHFRSSLLTWIYRIARNECRNHLKRRGVPAVPLDDILGSRYEADGPRGLDAGSARAEAVRRAVLQLPLKMREVVVLKYQHDLSYAEMSRVLRCPPGTVASRLNRALAELGSRLPPDGGRR